MLVSQRESLLNLPDGAYEIDIELYDHFGTLGSKWLLMSALTDWVEEQCEHDVKLAAITDACMERCGARAKPLPVHEPINKCPCIQANPIKKVMRFGQECILYTDSDGNEHQYPSDYGTKECRPWDSMMPPSCADSLGRAKADAPSWCQSRWCYVNKDVCDQDDVKRTFYFGDEKELWFSYKACGEKQDLFTAARCAPLKTAAECAPPCEWTPPNRLSPWLWLSGTCMDGYQAAETRYTYPCTESDESKIREWMMRVDSAWPKCTQSRTIVQDLIERDVVPPAPCSRCVEAAAFSKAVLEDEKDEKDEKDFLWQEPKDTIPSAKGSSKAEAPPDFDVFCACPGPACAGHCFYKHGSDGATRPECKGAADVGWARDEGRDASEAACNARTAEHDAYCGANSQWKVVLIGAYK